MTPIPTPPVHVPLPPRFAVQQVFVAREREREALHRALEAAGGDGLRRIAILSGEPGIGKTSLAAAFARDAHALGAVVLYGRCDEDRAISYQTWMDALAHLCTHVPLDLLREHVEARGASSRASYPNSRREWISLPATTSIPRRSSTCCSAPLSISSVAWRPPRHWFWCSTTFTGPTGDR